MNCSSRARLRALLPFGLLATTFATMAAIGWYRWPEVLIDYGRELYFPWRISAGEMLYKDLLHLYGPLGTMPMHCSSSSSGRASGRSSPLTWS